jgi:hypothetical protein
MVLKLPLCVPGPDSFAFGVMQQVIEATRDKPDEPKPAQEQSGKDPNAVALGRKGGLKGIFVLSVRPAIGLASTKPVSSLAM